MLDALADIVRFIAQDLLRQSSGAPGDKSIRQDLAEPRADRVTAPDLNFYGKISCSPSGRYAVGWEYSKKRSRVILFDRQTDSVVWKLTRGEVTHVNVSDQGAVSLGKETKNTTFEVLNREGETAGKARTGPVIFTSAMSPDGAFAWCISRHPKQGEPTRKLVAVNVENGRKVIDCDLFFRRRVEVFSVANDGFRVVSGQGIAYQFDPSGKLANEPEVRFAICRAMTEARESSAQLRESVKRCIPYVDESEVGPRSTSILRTALKRAEATTESEYGLAWIERLRGEIYEQEGSKKAALDAYRRALELNPDIGVKKRARNLESALEGSG